MGQRRKNGRSKPKYDNVRTPNCHSQPRNDDIHDTDEEITCILPSCTPWAVVILTLAFRVYYVIDSSSWWILHPDEIFQSMEVAHTELYGYGLRPFEFIPPPKGNNLSHYMLRERTLGMNALRSPLVPQFFMLVSILVSWTGLELNPYLLWRTSHVIISSFLPLSVYTYIRVVSRSSDVARLSSILTAVCAQLNIIGTHSLVNSFVSPFLFLALSRSMALLMSEVEVSGHTVKGRDENPNTEREGGVAEFIKEKMSRFYSYLSERKLHQNICWKDKKNHHILFSTLPNMSDSSKNGHQCENPAKHRPAQESADSIRSRHDSQSVPSNGKDRDESNTTSSFKTGQSFSTRYTDVRQRDSFCECDRHVCQGNGTQTPNYEVNNNDVTFKHNHRSAPMSDTSCTEFPPGVKKPEEKHDKSHNAINFLSGFILALCVYIRPDSATFVAITLLSNHRLTKTTSLLFRKSSLCHLCGGVVGVSLAVLDDFYFYGGLTLTPLNWIKFNLFSGVAPHLFGTSGNTFYIKGIFLQDVAMSVLSICFLSQFLACVLKFISKFFSFFVGSEFISLKSPVTGKSHDSICSKIIRIFSNNETFNSHCLSIVILTSVYSFIGHKEFRFLHDTLVLFLAAVSQFIITMLNVIISSPASKRFILTVLLLIVSTVQWQTFQKTSDKNVMTWPFTAHQYGRDVNQCLHYLSYQNDVTGLYLESSIQTTASFSILHKNVPIFFRLGKEFLELENSFAMTGNRSCVMDENCTIRYYSLNMVSDLIHSKNFDHLLKRLIESKTYNYAILKSDTDFLRPGFDKVFTTQTMSIWRRGYRHDDELTLAKMGSRIPKGGWNVTVQEYEAEVLKQLGNYCAALTRFQTALDRGLDTASVMASMAYCMHKMGNKVEMSDTLRRCYQKYTKKNCEDGYRPRVLKLGAGFREEAKKDLM